MPRFCPGGGAGTTKLRVEEPAPLVSLDAAVKQQLRISHVLTLCSHRQPKRPRPIYGRGRVGR